MVQFHVNASKRKTFGIKNQAGARPGVPPGLLHITDYHKNEAFPLIKCIRRCRMGRWSFWFWFSV